VTRPAEDVRIGPRRVAAATPPRVWLVVGDKHGDNGQVESLAAALPWPVVRKYVRIRPPYDVRKPRVRPTLHYVDPARSDSLEPPWPDVLITIGRRLSMVALWVQAQSAGHTKIVLVGKPSGMMGRFDLIVSSAIAQLPPRSNVFAVRLPLTKVNKADIAAASARWQPRLADLPRPLVAFLVGGPTNPFVFDIDAADRLVTLARKVVDQEGGTPYFSTSRRTPESVVARVEARLPAGARLFRWSLDAEDNPYQALLGLADGFVVTGDSITMLVEVVQLRKALAIFDLPLGRLGRLDQLRRSFAGTLFKPPTEAATDGLRRALAQFFHRLGLIKYTRDFRAFHQMLIDGGLAVRAGDALVPPSGAIPDDLAAAADRIEALIQTP